MEVGNLMETEIGLRFELAYLYSLIVKSSIISNSRDLWECYGKPMGGGVPLVEVRGEIPNNKTSYYVIPSYINVLSKSLGPDFPQLQWGLHVGCGQGSMIPPRPGRHDSTILKEAMQVRFVGSTKTLPWGPMTVPSS